MIRTLPAQTGTAFYLKKGDYLKVIDPLGQQVADLFCAAKENQENTLSSGRSIDYNETIYLSKGHHLYAQNGDIMLEILEDSCGRHDFLVTPCSLQMFQMINHNHEHHPSCLENLEKSMHEFFFDPSRITTTFNIFMNYEMDPSGRITLKSPCSKAGDFILFQAKIDLLVGLTACSDENTNAGSCKPIHYQIYNTPL